LILPDVNVLVLAHRVDQDEHGPVLEWLEGEVNSDRPFALADVAVAGFLRVVTNPRVYHRPTSLEIATAFVDGLVEQQTCVPVAAGARHWPILRGLVHEADARGNLVSDAHLAAIAIEHGGTIATRDRGFARFPGLRWFDPLTDRS
jgi:toxin-antitoxin system PIN domain toxin